MNKKNLEKFSRKIAAAIFESIRSNSASDLEQTEKLLQELALITSKNSDVKSALKNPSILKKDKLAILQALAELTTSYAAISITNKETLAKSLALVVEYSVSDRLNDITEQFSALLRALKRLASIEVSSAFDYSAEERQEFQALLAGTLGLTPEINWQLKPELIGGTIVKVRDQVLDSSVRGALKNLKEALL